MNILTILTYGACGLAGLALLTQLLPRHIEVERQAQVTRSANDILALAASNEGYQTFNPYRSADPALKIELFGPNQGVGSGFHFDGKDGKGQQTVAEVTPTTVHYNIDLGAMGQPVQTITAMPVDRGSHVTWRMEMDLGRNPVARIFGLFMDGMIGKTFEQGLMNLNTSA